MEHKSIGEFDECDKTVPKSDDRSFHGVTLRRSPAAGKPPSTALQ